VKKMTSKDIFNYIVDCFNKEKVEYVILHSYHNLPDVFESDIDIAINVDNIMLAIELLDDTLKNTEWRIIQYWRHEYYAADCVISNDLEFLQVDFCINYERNGRFILPIKEVTSKRIEYKNFYIPPKYVEFTYILAKKILKRYLSENSKEQLSNLLKNMDEQEYDVTKRFLVGFISEEKIDDVLNYIKMNNFDLLNLKQLNIELKKKTSRAKANLHYIFFNIGRLFERVIHPTGLFIVILGVDGSGKTTISRRLIGKYESAFRNVKHYHSRVRVLKDLSQITSNNKIDTTKPHSKNFSVGKFGSIIKFTYYYLDYLIGNIIITISKIKSTLVIIERYYYDYYIDTLRYNLKISIPFLKFFGKLIKRPNVIFILTGNSQILLERKNEITLDEINKQTSKINKVFLGKKDVYFFDTTETDADECVNYMIKICNDIMRGRRKWQD
jgi:thymidylate kinase